VIGNSAYKQVTPLPNPVNDARSIAKSLRDIGFVVSEGLNLDRVQMQSTIREFLREAARAQVAVVYYAGHGVQVQGRNYLVPIDVQFQAEGRMTDTMMDMDTITAGLDDSVRTNIVIMDACRNNPMATTATTQIASAGANRSIQAGTGLAPPTRRRRQQPVLSGAVAPHRHARARSTANADTRARRSCRRDQIQTGAMVALVAAGRGLSDGEVSRPNFA